MHRANRNVVVGGTGIEPVAPPCYGRGIREGNSLALRGDYPGGGAFLFLKNLLELSCAESCLCASVQVCSERNRRL